MNVSKISEDSNEEAYFYDIALKLTQEAGELVKVAFNKTTRAETSTKSDAIDLVTETDEEVEQLLFNGLKKKFPTHKFIGEESAAKGQKVILTEEPTWIIDPIDGTTNFVHKLPFIAISVALYVDKKPRIGIVYSPILNDLYTARKGRGAFKNGFPIKPSETKDLNKSLVMICSGLNNYGKVPNWLDIGLGNKRALAEAGIRGDRSFGSTVLSMCLIACGAGDAYIQYGVCCWDVAAAALIVEEAGGVVIDINGKEFNIMSRRVLCAGKIELASAISVLCQNVDYKPQDAE